MSDPTVHLTDLYEQCVSAFQRILSIPGLFNLRTPGYDSSALDTLLEEYGRFKIWSEQTRVYLPFGSRGSLDELVRERSKTKRSLANTLAKLVTLLETG